MLESLLDILVDPILQTPLELEVREIAINGGIRSGMLRAADSGNSYPIMNGIPRFALTDDAGQKQTESSFGFKWQQLDSYDSDEFKRIHSQWLVTKYGFANADEMGHYLAQRQRVMDAGCGGALSSMCWLEEFWSANAAADWIGVDISDAIDVAQERLGSRAGVHLVQADISHLPFREGLFGAIFSEGVLHHTPSTERALKALVPFLEQGGEIFFYVYRKKGPIREFTDDYIRGLISPLSPEEAWEALRPLTKLGQALAELQARVEVSEDIPLLDIKAGFYDVQRLIYWYFAKMFWNEDLPFETNHHINFDWYHPQYAHRQTEADVRRWCAEAGLTIAHFNEQDSGYTVRAVRG